jgi:hypothetical protein
VGLQLNNPFDQLTKRINNLDRSKVDSLMQERMCYSVKDAAAQLSMSRAKMFQLISRGVVQSLKIDGKRLVPDSALRELIAQKIAEQEAI